MENHQDYIMRVIYEMVRVILKFLFHMDIYICEKTIMDEQELAEKYNRLIVLVNDEKINEAENLLYELCGHKNRNDYLIGIRFYDYLNTLSDEFLENCHYSRKEIKDGLESLIKIYGNSDFLDYFLKDIFKEDIHNEK